jgi:GH15 family glucan-1,4-alpha-glucosidase
MIPASPMNHGAQPLPLGDYAIIGDGRSAALISRAGSIDWLCWPRFDSPSILGALLDEDAGHWCFAPITRSHVTRRYVGHTNVLETRFDTGSGVAVLTDLMPIASEDDKHQQLLPEHEIVRTIACERGEVEIELLFDARPDYGRRRVRARPVGGLGVRLDTGRGILALRTDVPTQITMDGRVQGRVLLRAGQVMHASLTFADEGIAVLPPLGDWSRAAVDRSIRWWSDWASHLRYDGPCKDAVIRSALALKLMVYAPSGAVAAAPTTSLPERLGGDLNWDYRYCWPRDASLTVRALFGLGCADEARAFVDWLLHTTRLTQPELRVLYDVYGNRPPDERILHHLAGYCESRPVRIGNAAEGQRQLDVYGEVIDAAAHAVQAGSRLDRDTGRMLCAFGRYVCRHWDEPDQGIWEPRGAAAHNTHSRVLCWVALDRLLQLHDGGHLRGAPVDMLRHNRDRIRRQVETHAWNPAIDSYVAHLDGERLDAALLLLSWYGFEDAGSDRMRRTYTRIREELGAGEGLLYRYRTLDSPGEGAFGVCSFWGAEYLALGGGTANEATAVFEQLCSYANDVGLFAEEIDPTTGSALGNFPQAFTHVGLINAALSLSRRLRGEAPHDRGVPERHQRPETEVRV